MKKSIVSLFAAVAAVTVLMFASCTKDQDYEEMLIGTWNASDGYVYTFNSDHTGRCADQEGYGLNFTWSLSGEELNLQYTSSGQIQKPGEETYFITKMSDSMMKAYELVYPDEIISFTKQ